MQQGGAVAMTKCSTTSKRRKKHWSFTGGALQISPTALQNRRTSAVLTKSTLTAKPMNNETCRRNGRFWQTQQSRQSPWTMKLAGQSRAATGNLQDRAGQRNLKTRGGPADREEDTRRTTGSPTRYTEEQGWPHRRRKLQCFPELLQRKMPYGITRVLQSR